MKGGCDGFTHCKCNMTGCGGNQAEIPADFNACMPAIPAI